jgi:hypothetical protein
VWLCSQGDAIEAAKTQRCSDCGAAAAPATPLPPAPPSLPTTQPPPPPPPPPLPAPVERHSQPPSTGRKPRGRGGGEGAAPPADRVQGGGGSKGLTFSLHITQSNPHNMLCPYKPLCACVPWLLG